MKTAEMAIALIFIAYGIYTAVIRKRAPEKLGKYLAMKERFGNSAGSILHIISYTLVPILVGIVLIIVNLLRDVN